MLTRPELGRWIRREDGVAILDHIGSFADRVHGAVTVDGLPDPDDAPFLEVALIVGVPLITRNIRHFPAERAGPAVVLTPREFLTAGTDQDNVEAVLQTLNPREIAEMLTDVVLRILAGSEEKTPHPSV